MLCPRCQSVSFEEFGDGLVRCVRCRALVEKHEEKHERLPEVHYCDT